MSFQTSAIVLAWVAIAILAFALSGLLRQLHLIRATLDPQRRVTLGPPRGIVAPPVDGAGRDGWRRPTVLLFMDSGCQTCQAIQTELEELSARDDVDFVAVFAGEADGHVPERVTLVTGEPDAFKQFNVSFTPFAVAVDSDGRVAAAQPLGSVDSLREFLLSQRERMATT
jgi:thiol-disulfide isomerase/thioredoxin